MIFRWVGAGSPDWGMSSGGRRDNGREPVGAGSWGQECQMAGGGMVGDRREGMAVSGAGGPDGQEGGYGRVHEGQRVVAGGSRGGIEQEFKMVGRQGLDQRVRSS